MAIPKFLCWLLAVSSTVIAAGDPFLTKVGDSTYVLGNDLWNVTIGKQYGTKLMYKGVDLVGRSVGHYVSYGGGKNDLNWTVKAPSVYSKTGDYTDFVFTATEGELHWVLTPTLLGAYQYFVNSALPDLGEFRTLWRLDNKTFTYGSNSERDELLPTLADIDSSTKTQDETWQRKDGTYITKYDFAVFMPNVEGRPSVWGTHGTLGGKGGETIGSWYIHGGKDYINGDQTKQELTIHRESSSGDTVQLNMIHGTHFATATSDAFPVGKTWGPWLWYLNNGSAADALARANIETAAWPYPWLTDSHGYSSRGSLSGQLTLSDNRPASGAAIFLGDPKSTRPTLGQGANYYYRTYADSSGSFTIPNVRAGTYTLQAWPNAGSIGDVSTVYSSSEITITSGSTTNLGNLSWKTQTRRKIWQIGDIDRLATGFGYCGPPHKHAQISKCPAGSFTYTVGTSKQSDWCFGMVGGTWTVSFNVAAADIATNSAAVLSVSLAGVSSAGASIAVNGKQVGSLSSSIPSDPCTYRSGTLAGEWHYFEYAVPAGTLKTGTNVVTFTLSKSDGLRGFIWDSVLLEWA